MLVHCQGVTGFQEGFFIPLLSNGVLFFTRRVFDKILRVSLKVRLSVFYQYVSVYLNHSLFPVKL